MEAIFRGGYRALRWIGVVNLLSFSLLAVSMASLIFGVQASMKGLEAGPVFALALVGLLFGWLLGSMHMNGWLASLLALVCGLALVGLSIGRLIKPLLTLANAFGSWFTQIAALERFSQKDLSMLAPSAFAPAWRGFTIAASTLIERSQFWLAGMANGHPAYDPLAVLLVWGFLAWVSATWAAWWLRRRQQALIGLAPSGFLLAASLAYSGGTAYAIITWIGAAIGLHVLGSYISYSNEWNRHHLDRAEIEFEWIVIVLFITAVLMGLSLAIPSFSIKKIAEQVQETLAPQSQASSNMAQALGLRQQVKRVYTPLETAQSPGLPNEHLLGSGPELSQEPVMQITIDGLSPLPQQLLDSHPELAPPSYHWRSTTYDQYNGHGWATTLTGLQRFQAGQSIADKLDNPPGAVYVNLRQHIQMASGKGGVLYATGELLSSSQDYQVAWRGNYDFFGAQATSGAYSVESRLASATPEQLRKAGQNYPDWIRNTYLTLPESVPRRVWDLALDLTATQPTAFDKAQAIESYLRKIPYTLKIGPPPEDRDTVDYFLFDLKRGYCDYYASAMAVLARAAGLPARVVIGYASGSYIPEKATFEVTEADAHAWTEIYFPGYGWIEFEPTAGRPAINRSEIKPASPPPDTPAKPVPSQSSKTARMIRRIFSEMIIVLIGLFLIYLLWRLIDRLWLQMLPPPKAIRLLFKRLYRSGQSLAGETGAGQTAQEFSTRLGQTMQRLWPGERTRPIIQYVNQRIQALSDAYAQVVYSPHSVDKTDRQQAIHNWQSVNFRLIIARIRKTFLFHL